MLPLSLLMAAQGRPMLIELKSGETYNGHLVKCDNYMNLILKHVVRTMPDGAHFFELKECYIRGNNIKYLRVNEDVLDAVVKQQAQQSAERAARGGFRGSNRARGQSSGRATRGSSNRLSRGGRGSDVVKHSSRQSTVYKKI